MELDLRSSTVRPSIFDLRQVWPFLLGYHAYDSTSAEREYLMSVKKSEYEAIKNQWQSISTEQAKRFTKFRYFRNEDLAVVVLLILTPLISPNSSKGGGGVGMSIDPKLFVSNFPVIMGTLPLLIGGKTILVAVAGRLFGISIISAIRVGLLLAPGGEFAFVAFGEAVNQCVSRGVAMMGDILEDPAKEPNKDMYMMTIKPEDAPNQPEPRGLKAMGSSMESDSE